MQILIKNGDVVSSSGVRRADVLIEDGKIAKVEENLSAPGAQEYDAAGRYVFPGFIDGHTHLDMSTATTHTADDFASGSKAAIAGGTTTVLDFATQERGETLVQAFDNWTALAKGKSSCDYGFHMAITDWNPTTESELPIMTRKGVTSYKLYMAYNNLRVPDGVIYKVLEAVKKQGGIVGMHCENGDLVNVITKELMAEGKTSPASHPLSRPDIVEAEAITRYLYIAELVDWPVNIVHLSTQRGLQAILAARSRGQKVYIETCPQYLLLTEQEYNLPGFESAKYVLSPPLRSEMDKEALWHAVEDGAVDTIGSDHCSFRYADQKTLGKDDFSQIPNGAPGVDVRPELMYTYGVAKGRITVERFIQLVSENPARLFGMYPVKGAVQPGSDADIVIWEKEWAGVRTNENQHTAADYTPYNGFEISGRPAYVFLRGELVVVNGEVVKEKSGEYVSRKPCEFWR